MTAVQRGRMPPGWDADLSDEYDWIPLRLPPDLTRISASTRLSIEAEYRFAGQAAGGGIARNAYWGELITNTMPKAVMGTVVDRLRHVFVRQFAVRGGAGIIGKAIPFGIGAAIGGTGNHILGRRVLQQSRLAFATPPHTLPLALAPREGAGVLTAATSRLTRAGAGLGAFAVDTSRGLRAAASRAARRNRRNPKPPEVER